MSYEHFATWRDQPEPLTPFLTVIIPAYNEIARIVPAIASIASHLAESGYGFELIVSDDGSTDGTGDACRALGLRNLVVIGDGTNRGKGAAVNAGVKAARGEWILFTDADLSTPIEELDEMLTHRDNAEVIIGSRAAAGADEQAKSRLRSKLSGVSRSVVAILLGLDIADSQCGFKLFSAHAATELFGRQKALGFGFDAEILFLAARLGFGVVEVPVRWIDAPGSKVDPVRAPFGFLADLVKVRVRAWRGVYEHAVKNDSLRIGVVTALPPSKSSLTEYGEHLVNSLSAVDEVDEVIVFAEDSNGTPTSKDDVTIIAAWTFDSLLNIVRLIRAARTQRPDVVLFNLHFTSFGTRKVACGLGLCAPMVLRLFGTPTVVLTHNLVDTTDLEAAGYWSKGPKQRILVGLGRLLTRVLLRANHVVTTMPEYVDVLRTKYGATNVSLTPHGAFECPPLAFWDEDAPRQLLAFGKFGTYKRVDELVDVFRELRLWPGNEHLELVIAGTDSPVTPGYLASVESSCADMDDVIFTGYVEEDQVAGLFHNAHIVVFPYTATTGSSGPLHQAGSYGRAVVAPRVGDFIDLIEDEGYVAQSFTPGDVASLARAIDTVLCDEDLMRSMGQHNYIAACGLPLADIAEWHVGHMRNVLGR
ncbi:MAG: glycosyltransferase [Acidimicrobiales bacterium]